MADADGYEGNEERDEGVLNCDCGTFDLIFLLLLCLGTSMAMDVRECLAISADGVLSMLSSCFLWGTCS